MEFPVKCISPSLGLGGGRLSGHKGEACGRHELVEVMWYIFVSVERGRNLPDVFSTGSLDPYVEVKLGCYGARTEHFRQEKNPRWGVVFAFSDDYMLMQPPEVEVVLKSRDDVRHDYVGKVCFDLKKIPTRLPSESPVSPEWCALKKQQQQHERGAGDGANGELLLSVWKGTQCDEAFRDAWHSDSATPVHPSPFNSKPDLRSKAYSGPLLWCLRLQVLRAEIGLAAAGGTNNPVSRFANYVYVQSEIGAQKFMTMPVSRSLCSWSSSESRESFVFVVAEPFAESLVLSLHGCDGGQRRQWYEKEDPERIIGRAEIPLAPVLKRPNEQDDTSSESQWFHLETPSGAKVLLRLYLEERCCLLDGSLRHSAQPMGSLELGILKAEALSSVKTREGRQTVDPYCLIKYWDKWVRTRTILGNPNPRYNEHYSWEVYDPCTDLVIGVFDNADVTADDQGSRSSSKHAMIGKVRIRLSTLEAGRLYALSYPLVRLTPQGLRKRGELQVTIRFSYTSVLAMSRAYARPLLPALQCTTLESLWTPEIACAEELVYTATSVTAARLSRQEPPLRKEVVEMMCNEGSQLYSMRKYRSVYRRCAALGSVFLAGWRWYGDMAKWKDPCLTLLCHVLFLAALCYPHLLLPAAPFCLLLLVLWNRRQRPSHPEHVDAPISCVDAHPDELDEEFDTFPTSRPTSYVMMRYDRLRSVACRIHRLAVYLVEHLERVDTLLHWRDPRATTMFAVFCSVGAIALYAAPRLLAGAAGLYAMRHPWFRRDTPSALHNFFTRLPSKRDCVI
jgi:hypothetical protein